MSAKRGLGRGFDSLIPTELLDESFDPTAGQDESVSDLRQVKISKIIADPEQPRRHFDEAALDELAQSIALHGILQPIVVTPHGDGYQIVAGERRWRAAGLIGLDKVPAIVRTLSGQHKLELSLIENLQRRNLNVMETATAYLKLRDQFGMTLEQIGERVGGKSTSAVSNTLRLLKLPDDVKQALAEGKFTEGQARPLLGLDKKVIQEILPKILRESWSARRIEQYISEQNTGVKKSVPAVPAVRRKDDEKRLAKRFGATVRVSANTQGAGSIVIKFDSDDERQRIEKLLG